MAIDGNTPKQLIEVSQKEVNEFAQFKLTQEYLKRALLKLKESMDYLDQDNVDTEDFEEDVAKFIADVKRKRLV